SSVSNVERLIKIDKSDGNISAGWNTGAESGVGNGTVNAIAFSGADVFVGGTFTRYRSATDNVFRLVKVSATNGSLNGDFGATSGGFNSDVKTLLVDGGNVYAGGAFLSYRGE